MVKPHFEAVRIARDEATSQELEYKMTLLWCNVDSVEEATMDDFKNGNSKCIVRTSCGNCLWLLATYDVMVQQWTKWLDAASNIQSVFRNN